MLCPLWNGQRNKTFKVVKQKLLEYLTWCSCFTLWKKIGSNFAKLAWETDRYLIYTIKITAQYSLWNVTWTSWTRNVDKLTSQTAEPEISTPHHSRVPSFSSPIFSEKCIFCSIVTKFVDGEGQQHYSCRTFLADETIRKCASFKGDKKILASATDELVTKEAAYHLCCSRKFTESFNSSQRENKNEISLIQEAFDAINHMLPGLYEGSNVTEFSDFTNKAVESLHNLNQEDASL